MRRKAWVTAVCVLATAAMAFGLVGTLAGQTHVPPRQCRIGAFNLQMLHNGGSGTPALEARFKKIASIIAAKDLQVVALQEVNLERIKLLQEGLNCLTSHNWKYLISPQNVSQRVAVLFQADRVSAEFRESRTLSLHDEDHEKQRDALLVNVYVLPNGFDFTLVVVHLATNDSELRQKQLKKLHQWTIDQLETGVEQDIIIAGDFNTPLLMNQEDFEILDGGIGLYIVQQDTGKDLYSSHCDITYKNPVDFIIIAPDCRAEYIDNTASFESYRSEEEKSATSDHRLAWATFSVDDLDDPNSTPLVVSDSALVLEMPESIEIGKQVTVSATTFAGADCTIRVLYKGASKGLITAQSYVMGGKEHFVWTWEVKGGTDPGIATVQVQATWAWGHALKIGTFEVVPKEDSSTNTEQETE